MEGRLFEASVIFEANFEANGSCFLVIYGKHANGYFIAIPNWGVCCEAAESRDKFYNAEKLRVAGFSTVTAHILSNAIYKMVAHLSAQSEGATA